MAKIKFVIFIIITILLLDHVIAQTIVVKEHNENIQIWMEAEAGRITSPMEVYDIKSASKMIDTFSLF